MIKSLSQLVHVLPMVNQEGNAHPGAGLTVLQTVTYFVIIPVALFAVIGGIAWIASSPKKNRGDVINQIPGDDADFITFIA
jgi:hypothetical protein